jgi:hypothetical protein
MAELDPTGGMAEKIVPLVRFPVLMRVVLPGGLATALLYPILVRSWPKLAFHFPTELKDSWQQFVLIGGMVFVLGALTSALNGEFYKVYEGRVLWPRRLLEPALTRQKARLEKLLRQEAELVDNEDRAAEYSEVWYQLRLYPIDQNDKQFADRPTLLGNILSGYEQYPRKRYGMDSIFYWTRLWMQLEKEKKEELDNSWSVADGFLSLSVVSFLGGSLWFVVATLDAFNIFSLQTAFSWRGSFLVGIVSLALGYGFYRISLPFHRQNGELFKSIFDLYRDKIWSLTCIKPGEKEAWDEAWSYLQYLQVPCHGKLESGADCDEWNDIALEKCPTCGTEVPRALPNRACAVDSSADQGPPPTQGRSQI